MAVYYSGSDDRCSFYRRKLLSLSGMGRIQGAEIYARYRPYMITIIVICVAIWMTPRTLSKISTASELSAMGGANHPHLGLFGLMTAKNTAVNIIILTTFLSFLFYRRSGKHQRRVG